MASLVQQMVRNAIRRGAHAFFFSFKMQVSKSQIEEWLPNPFFSWFPLFCNVCKTEQDTKPKLLELKRWMKRTETTAAKTKNKSNKVLHVFPAGSLFIRATVLVLMWYIGTSHGYSGWVIIPRPTFSARNLYWTVLFARLPAVHGKGGKNMLEKTPEPGSFGGWAWDFFCFWLHQLGRGWNHTTTIEVFPTLIKFVLILDDFLAQLLEWIEVSMERWRSQRHMSVMWTKVGILPP